MEDQAKKQVQQDHSVSAENFQKMFAINLEEQQKLLQIKLGFVAIFTILLGLILDPQKSIDAGFKYRLSILFLATIILLIIDLWLSQLDTIKGLKKSGKIVILKKVRAIAAIEPKLNYYGHRAEELLITDDAIRQSMLNGEAINVIVESKIGISIYFYISLTLWSLIFLALPILIFLEVRK